MFDARKVMTYLARLITILLFISTWGVARKKVQLCFKNQPLPLVRSSFFLDAFSAKPPLHENEIELASARHDIDMKHIVPPPEFRVNGTILDADAVNVLPFLRFKSLLPSLRYESFLFCQIGDLYPDGSIQFH